MKCGIYSIVTPDGKRYVGSSRDIETRLRRHLAGLRKGLHQNHKLQSAFNVYGEVGLVLLHVEIDVPIERLRDREQYYMDLWMPEHNIAPKAINNTGIVHGPLHKERVSAARKGAGNGMFGKAHTPEAVAKIAAASMSRKDLPKTKLALSFGRGWNKGIAFSEESRKRMSDAKPKKAVHRVSPSGEVVLYKSIREAVRDGFHQSHVSECCRGLSASHRGYQWRFANGA